MKTIVKWIIIVMLFALVVCLVVEIAILRNVKSTLEYKLSEIATTISDTTSLQDSREQIEKQNDLLANITQLLEQQTNINQEYDKKEVVTEIHTVASEQYHTDFETVKEALNEILNTIDQLNYQYPVTETTNSYITNYYMNTGTEIKKEEKEEDIEEPLHVHEFDAYGNCIDETCTAHEEVEVFDLIDLKRSLINEDYYYRLMWEGDINFEIVYAFTTPDDVEITLYSDETHMDVIPMDRMESTYTATLLESGMYYIQVHTLTDGDVEISIY